jgi:hypothetical protein
LRIQGSWFGVRGDVFLRSEPNFPVVNDAAGGSGLTLAFSGTNGSCAHAPTDNTNGPGGDLNIIAPTSGTWSGVAIYEDPSLATGVDVSAAGNSPTWDITALIYRARRTGDQSAARSLPFPCS